MESTLHLGDCLEVMAGMDAGSVDAIVTDSPYGLEFMGKEWDRLEGSDAPGYKERPRMTPDHMGKGFKALPNYYATGIKAQLWHRAWATEALRVLPPSHYLLAFGGTRTWHRLACAIEDAGFEIRDTLMWLYGSGFPKGKACLKPAWEPIILARKPGPMRELGIEECKIGTTRDVPASLSRDKTPNEVYGEYGGGDPKELNPNLGRWPANLVLDEGSAAMLGDKARFYFCAKASRAERNAGCEGMEERAVRGITTGSDGRGEKRTIGRPSSLEKSPLAMGRNHHPTVKPVALMRWLVKLVAYPGDLVLDPFMGSGTTGIACAMEGRDFIGIEKDAEYVEISRRRIMHAEAQLRLV